MNRPIVSKIRVFSGNNSKQTAAANRGYAKYIATRPGVDLSPINNLSVLEEEQQLSKANDASYVEYISNRPRSQGLFGNYDTSDLYAVSSEISSLSLEGKVIYRCILSLHESDAVELGYLDKSKWVLLLNSSMRDIASTFNIPITSLKWNAAFHFEKEHPHVHIMFWNSAKEVRSSFITVAKQQKCREIFSREVFAEERQRAVIEKTAKRDYFIEFGKEIANLSTQIFDLQFAEERIQKIPDRIDQDTLRKYSTKLLSLAKLLPDSGRMTYKFMPPEVKANINDLIDTMFQRNDLKKEWTEYFTNVASISDTYSVTANETRDKDFFINSKREEIQKNAENDLRTRLGNIILKAAVKLRSNEQFQSLSSEAAFLHTFFPNTSVQVQATLIEEYNSSELKDSPSIDFITSVSDSHLSHIEPDPEPEPEVTPPLFCPDDLEDSFFHKNTATWGDYSKSKGLWTSNYKLAQEYLYGSARTPQNLDFAFTLLSKEAKLFNPLALYDLGTFYERGYGNRINLEIAQEYYSEAVMRLIQYDKKNNDSYAKYRIGKMYLCGQGVNQSYGEAVSWLQKAADDGQKGAQFSLARLYYEGQGVEKNLDQAFSLYQKSATDEVLANRRKQSGNAFASYELAKMYETGLGTEQNLEKAEENYSVAYHRFIKSLNDIENDTLLYYVGKMLYEGKGVKQNTDLAITYFERSAALDNLNTKYTLANIYIKMDDVEKLKIALGYLEELSNAGHSFAQYSFGKLLTNSALDCYDLEKGLSYLYQSAERKNDWAQYQLGRIYTDAKSPVFNLQEGIRFLQESKKLNNPQAQYYLGMLMADSKLPIYNLNEAKRLLTESAEQGNSWAQYKLGHIYTEQPNCIFDIKKGVSFLQAAVQQENPQAQYYLGTLMADKNSSVYNLQDAQKLLLKAAEQGNDWAYYQLGHIYTDKHSSKYDLAKGIECLQAAIQMENSQAECYLGALFADHTLPIYNVQQALKYLEKSAKKGNSNASYQLGCIYTSKQYNAYDFNLGVTYLQQSVEQGNAQAEYYLGKLMTDNKTPIYNFDKGMELLLSAVNKKNSYAQYLLGRLYLDETLSIYDREKGFEYLRKSILDENPLAQYYLGKLLSDPKQPEFDLDEALPLLIKATDKNYYAQYQLGRIYMNKELGLYDPNLAISYFEKSADAGNFNAQCELGRMYYFGDGIKKDRDLGFTYLYEASINGNDYAKSILEHGSKFEQFINVLSYRLFINVFNTTVEENEKQHWNKERHSRNKRNRKKEQNKEYKNLEL